MSRAIEEWTGKTDDEKIPDRVRIRVFRRFDGICQGPCGQRLKPGRWEVDHTIALCNGGVHAEGNLRPVCNVCHAGKTRDDVAEKSRAERKMKKVWLKKPKREKWKPTRPWVRHVEDDLVHGEEQ
jgi:5-methylcytosine-specific restriction enzyme A